uniref:(northern house mosquito) hypothetical protein n=1 Tax=Culex pipiens TaxID=7175 RepID=A0A8D8KAQ6_CULPI
MSGAGGGRFWRGFRRRRPGDTDERTRHHHRGAGEVCTNHRQRAEPNQSQAGQHGNPARIPATGQRLRGRTHSQSQEHRVPERSRQRPAGPFGRPHLGQR